MHKWCMDVIKVHQYGTAHTMSLKWELAGSDSLKQNVYTSSKVCALKSMGDHGILSLQVIRNRFGHTGLMIVTSPVDASVAQHMHAAATKA